MTYEEAVNYIHGLKRGGENPGLARMTSMLKRLGNPEEKLRIIHVAGTNGKGSTSAMIDGILRAAGYTTGLFTSPFLDSFTNRIKLAGQDINPDELAGLVSTLRPIAEEEGLTQFEFITMVALVYYAQKNVDAVVLEVGLGGRFDATNAVVKPLLTVITNIGFDHMEILGDTLAKIAAEKAGILKQGIPLVTAVEEEESWQVIKTRADELQVPVRRLDHDFMFRSERSALDLTGQCFTFRNQYHELINLCISLLGAHQLKNASVAVAAALWLNSLGMSIDEEAIQEGLRSSRWPGRFEVMSQSPLVIMDGSHNTHGMKALRATLDELLPNHSLRWVVGMMGDKEAEGMLKQLLGRDVVIYACAPDIPRAQDANVLAANASGLGFTATAYESVSAALEKALKDVQAGEVVLVAGSLYMISEARRAVQPRGNKGATQ